MSKQICFPEQIIKLMNQIWIKDKDLIATRIKKTKRDSLRETRIKLCIFNQLNLRMFIGLNSS